MKLPVSPDSVKGFLDPEEGEALHRLAVEGARLGPCLEVGSYCGKSTLYLGTACREAGAVLYAVDHHRGSEEHQRGQDYHDPELYDASAGLMDSFPAFRDTLRRAVLEDTVVPIVAPSALAARHWCCPLGMVFIDGGHSLEAAMTDYRAWAPHVIPGGLLLIHDIFPDRADGGQAPYRIWKLALASGLFADEGKIKTLGVLRRVPQ
ncbi:MAG TPA: class I SAM-dependent methyltransferase [Gammaproteobacteria bacterium]|nr:class I SAM-dependent methyltransferase [Gammaproteobacteria bacterium]